MKKDVLIPFLLISAYASILLASLTLAAIVTRDGGFIYFIGLGVFVMSAVISCLYLGKNWTANIESKPVKKILTMKEI